MWPMYFHIPRYKVSADGKAQSEDETKVSKRIYRGIRNRRQGHVWEVTLASSPSSTPAVDELAPHRCVFSRRMLGLFVGRF